MKMYIKKFWELRPRELYEILRLRSEVFIVEQGGCYQDMDYIDYDSTHIYLVDESHACAGCIRVFPKKGEEGTAQLGRLVVRDRLRGYGRELMDEAEAVAAKEYGARRLFLTGRRSARVFYEKCGYLAEVPQGYTQNDAPYFLFRKVLS